MTPGWLRHLPAFLRRHIAGRSYLQRVIGNTGWIIGERALRYAIGFLVGVWIARYLGPEQYGLLNYAAAFVSVFAFMVTLGLDGLVVRDMVRDPGTRDDAVGTLLMLRLSGGFAMVLIAVAAAVIVRPDDPRAVAMIVPLSLAQLLLAFEAFDAWFQANVTSRYTAIARSTALLAMTAVRVVLILWHAPIVAFAWAVLAEYALFALAMVASYRRSGQRLSFLRPTIVRAKAMLAEGWPLILAALVAGVSLRIDQVMLGHIAGYAEVGIYALAIRVVEATYILPASLALSVFPAMLKSRQADRAAYAARIQGLFDLMLWTAIAIAVPLSLLAPAIIKLLAGPEYSGAGPVLALLAWMPVLVFFNVIRQRWLFAEGALRTALSVEVCVCVLNVLGNLALIPRFGAAGAAIAALIALPLATLLLAPFSPNIRESLAMLLRAVLAPQRYLYRIRRSSHSTTGPGSTSRNASAANSSSDTGSIDANQ